MNGAMEFVDVKRYGSELDSFVFSEFLFLLVREIIALEFLIPPVSGSL